MTEQSELEKQGLADLEEGLDTLDAAADVAAVGEMALAEGVSDVSLTIAQIVALLRNSRPTILNLAPERIRAHRLKGGQRVK